MRLVFDRGTLLLEDLPADLDLAAFPEVRWDSRVGKLRAPAHLAYRLASDLRRRGIALDEAPRPALDPPSGFRPPALRSYQEAALAGCCLAALPGGSFQQAVQMLRAMAEAATRRRRERGVA